MSGWPISPLRGRAEKPSLTLSPVVVYGAERVVGGTSAVAPLYAGVFAAFGRKLGFIDPRLWANQTAFIDVTTGDNVSARAAPQTPIAHGGRTKHASQRRKIRKRA